MRKFLISGRRRYALALFVIAASVVLMGNQCAPKKPPVPKPTGLSIDPSEHDFGSVAQFSMSPAQTFTVTNNGPDASGPLTLSFQGGALGQFATSNNNCTGAQLDAGQSCDVDVRFTPTIVGSSGTNLVVMADPGGTATATLSGTGAP